MPFIAGIRKTGSRVRFRFAAWDLAAARPLSIAAVSAARPLLLLLTPSKPYVIVGQSVLLSITDTQAEKKCQPQNSPAPVRTRATPPVDELSRRTR